MRACDRFAFVGWAVAVVTGSSAFAGSEPMFRFDPPDPRRGDAVAVYVQNDDESLTTVPASVFGHHLTLFRVSQDTLRGVFAVPMELEPGGYEFAMSLADRTLRTEIQVLNRRWGEAQLTVSSRFTRETSPSVQARLRQEEDEWRELWLPVPTPPMHAGRFVRPVQGGVTAPFGTRRVFNGKTRTRHYGLDLEARTGTAVVAAGAGRVVMSNIRWTSGGTVVVDHGHGLFTAYFHLSKRLLRVGDRVDPGEAIGLAGATGRVTGPHLHLAVLVRQERERKDGSRVARGLYVDPDRFLALVLGPRAAAGDGRRARR